MKVRDLIAALQELPDQDVEFLIGNYNAHLGQYHNLCSPEFGLNRTIFVRQGEMSGRLIDVTDSERDGDREAMVFTPE
jgi:hypothetical protein